MTNKDSKLLEVYLRYLNEGYMWEYTRASSKCRDEWDRRLQYTTKLVLGIVGGAIIAGPVGIVVGALIPLFGKSGKLMLMATAKCNMLANEFLIKKYKNSKDPKEQKKYETAMKRQSEYVEEYKKYKKAVEKKINELKKMKSDAEKAGKQAKQAHLKALDYYLRYYKEIDKQKTF